MFEIKKEIEDLKYRIRRLEVNHYHCKYCGKRVEEELKTYFFIPENTSSLKICPECVTEKGWEMIKKTEKI